MKSGVEEQVASRRKTLFDSASPAGRAGKEEAQDSTAYSPWNGWQPTGMADDVVHPLAQLATVQEVGVYVLAPAEQVYIRERPPDRFMHWPD